MFLGLGPCTIGGVNIPGLHDDRQPESAARAVAVRREPASAALIGNLDSHAAVGTQTYRGLKLSFQRRSATGISLNGNYTWSRCFGLEMPTGAQFGIGFVDPSNPDYDRGHCDQDRTHLANFTVGAQTPRSAMPRSAPSPRTGGFRVSSTRAREAG